MGSGKPVKALLLGATGLVGHYLWRQWRERPDWQARGTRTKTLFAGMDKLDIKDVPALQALMASYQPDITVLLASNPFVDYCEQQPEETRALNVEATLAAARAARDANSTFVFFSSDYVFDGNGGPYGEDDPVSPVNEYGRQKVEAERGIAAIGPNHIILRVSGVFGWELGRKNFVMQVLDRCAAGTSIQAATDISYNPTYACDLPEVLAQVWEGGHRGLFHACGPDELVRKDFAVAITEAFGRPSSAVEGVTAESMKTPAKRPLKTSMKTDKLRGAARARMRGAVAGLRHMRATEAEWSKYAADNNVS